MSGLGRLPETGNERWRGRKPIPSRGAHHDHLTNAAACRRFGAGKARYGSGAEWKRPRPAVASGAKRREETPIEGNGRNYHHHRLLGDPATLEGIRQTQCEAAHTFRFPPRHPVQQAIEDDGPTGSACKMGLEGIVSKRKDSPYRSGRSPDWLKMKNPAAPAVRREAEEDWGR
jgi:hypothetical protein